MNKKLRNIYIFSILFLLIDQIIKIFISSKMILNQSIILIKNFFNITYVHNTGAAFSILSGARMFFILIGLFTLIFLALYIRRLEEIDELDKFSYPLLLGGILGNLIDRIIYGYVIDYISLNIFGYHFPIFNFADMCIVIGVILIFIKEIYGRDSSK